MKMRLLTFLSSYSSFIFLLTNAFILTPRLQQRALEVEVVKSPSSSPTSSGSVLVKSLGQRQGIVQGQRGASFQLEPTQSDYGDSRQVEDISVDNLVISRDLPGVHDDKDDRFHPEGREIYGGAVVSPHGISGIRELRRHVFPSTIDDDYEYDDDDDDDLRDEDGQQTRGQSGESVAALPKKSLFHLNEAKWTVKQTPSSFSMELVHPSKPSLTTTDDKASKRDKRQHASLYYPQELNYLANLPKYQKIPGRPRLPFHPLPPATHHGPTVSPNVIRELPPIYYGPRSTQSPVKHIYYPQNETKQKFTGHNAPQKLDPQRQEYIGYVRSQADQHHQGPYHPLSGTTTTFRPLVYHSTLASPTRPSGKYVQTFPHTTKSPVDVPYVEAIPQATDSRPLPKQTRPHHLQQQQQQQQQSPFNRQKLRLQKELIALRKLQSLYGQEPSAPSAVQRPFHTPAVLPIAVHASPDWAGFKQLATQDAHKLREPANTKNNPYSYKILGNEVRDQKPHSKRGISHTFARGDHSGNSIQDDRESFDYYAPHLSDLTSEEPEEYVEDDELPDQYETESKLKTKPVFDTFGYWVPSQRNPFDVVEGSKDRLPN